MSGMFSTGGIDIKKLEWKDDPSFVLNKVVDEYQRITLDWWKIVALPANDVAWMLQIDYGISVLPVSDLQWNAECCHWGRGVGYNPIEAILTCFIDYAKSVKDGGE